VLLMLTQQKLFHKLFIECYNQHFKFSLTVLAIHKVLQVSLTLIINAAIMPIVFSTNQIICILVRLKCLVYTLIVFN